jgi:twitching motility protein PilT
MIDALNNVRFTDVFHVARAERASDIHLASGSPPAIRVNGELRFVQGAPLGDGELRDIASILGGANVLARVVEGEDLSIMWTEARTRTRAHLFQTRDGLAISIRLLHEEIPTLEALHLPAVVKSLVDRPRGLVLVAGPTGSGKSTSLAALIDTINATRRKHIITIEDPIEYRHASKLSLVAQREVGRDTSSFASAVLGALRADPDVIMLGEMRDAETMRAALTASETGHLVFATLHTGDASQTIDRIIDAFPSNEQSQIRIQLAQVLVAVLCQRLVVRANGCGRRVAAEILVATDAVRNLIREGRTHQLRNIMLTGRQSGMQTLEHHLAELVAQREIDRSTAAATSDRPEDVRLSQAVEVS